MDLYSPSITPIQLFKSLQYLHLTDVSSWTVPYTGNYFINCYGGGGGGGCGGSIVATRSNGCNGGSAGNQGESASVIYKLTVGEEYAIAIGTAGLGGVATVPGTYARGAAGTETAFGSLLSAAGGSGGYPTLANIYSVIEGRAGQPGEGRGALQGGSYQTIPGVGFTAPNATLQFGASGGGGGGALGDSTTAYVGGNGGNGAFGSIEILYVGYID